ncbi:mannosylfructose-6-phosphate phosphatase [Agrobacterium larrymoorei]|uniref:Mannosylfructose-6-phosphate phosphatase n=1 Tax=Agrobacterium larrymoorei TaxID=160699 RepID=A0AAJ2BKG3_9HYPH|nr:HAD-IIB family hydrolase [Agrobacterium larrymoorei]MDR6104314.1 mannosylfructose-6-phosphate phosphatase [Agrobacterium larrymoorei]
MKPVRLFSTDLDGTVVGNDEATAHFRDFWHALPEETRPLLVFNSGRLIDDQLELLDTVPLPRPDYIIGGVGTMLSRQNEPGLSKAYASQLGAAFDADRIASVMKDVPGISLQPERYQHDLKSSWYLHNADEDVLADIERRLNDNGVDARIVYSSARDLDVLPRAADKGAAIRWLCDHLRVGLDEIVVAGDTGNDRAMFELPDVRGVVVANALEELRSFASDKHNLFIAPKEEADGVILGLKHWISSSETQK